MRPIDGDELMERLQSRFYAHNLKCDFDRCARSVILSCMEAVQRSPTICEPPNDPMTLEELREMDGEPVWVEHYNGGEWVIVSWNIYDEIAYTRKARLSAYNYGLSDRPGWLAYRRKPEEGENAFT